MIRPLVVLCLTCWATACASPLATSEPLVAVEQDSVAASATSRGPNLDSGTPVVVAAVAGGDVLVWRDGQGEASPMGITDAVGAWPSPDGTLVAILRESVPAPGKPSGLQSLWLTRADGDEDPAGIGGRSEGLREVVTNADLEAALGEFRKEDPLAGSPGVWGVDWLPGTRTLAWRVSPRAAEAGGGPPDVVHSLDADSGASGQLPFEAYDGFLRWSPDGRWAALTGGPQVDIVGVDGGSKASSPLLGAQIGRGHYNWMPLPRWAEDSRAVMVAVPQSDATPEWQGGNGLVEFHLLEVSVPDASVQTRGVFTADLSQPDVSPDFSQVAYYGRADNGTRSLEVLDVASATSWTVTPAGLGFVGWSPDSERFLLASNLRGALFVGRPGQEPLRLPGSIGTEGVSAVWLDADRFVYAERINTSGRVQWHLRVGHVDGTADESYAALEGDVRPELTVSR